VFEALLSPQVSLSIALEKNSSGSAIIVTIVAQAWPFCFVFALSEALEKDVIFVEDLG